MLELGRVDFEVTLTLCRWEWGSCAPCYVPARSNSDGGSSFPRLLSPPLFQHHSFQDSTSLSKTRLSGILPPQDPTFARCRRMQSFQLGFILKVQGSNFFFSNSGFSHRGKNLEKNKGISLWVLCYTVCVSRKLGVDLCLLIYSLQARTSEEFGVCRRAEFVHLMAISWGS